MGDDRLVAVGDGVWNLRGRLKIGGLLDIGTHASLVRLAGHGFAWIDAYPLGDDVRRDVDAITGGPDAVEYILNVHPFHTLYVKRLHELYPDARLYGTRRHLAKLSRLPWQSDVIEEPALQAQLGADFAFSVPAGVDFVSDNDRVHFSSVLVRHRASNVLHIDDTLSYFPLPKIARAFGASERLSFHPSLGSALHPRPGAADAFAAWARGLADEWGDAATLCTAHNAIVSGTNGAGPIGDQIRAALARAERRLAKHRRKYGEATAA